MNASKRSTKTRVDPDDAPDLSQYDPGAKKGHWYVGEREVSRAEGIEAFRREIRKQRVNMLLDPDVVDYFKAKAGGRGYQTLINEALRHAMSSERLEAILRRVVREELERLGS